MLLHILAATAFTVCSTPGFPWETSRPSASDAAQQTPKSVGDPAHARFNGRAIDLARSWEGAHACIQFDTETNCYETEAMWEAAHPDHASPAPATNHQAAPLATCATALKLYDGTSYTGTSLFITTRGAILNLSTFGFDNRASSYKVGTCSADFFAGANGLGGVYPGNTNAGASAASMLSGWDNTVSSVYLY
ncbi:MAG TPA: hypothetical protein PLV68_02665 [Ilumatobacteraceae bacterium]|nr:hypothetical protein [Ilumatobacteraceae bacterium]